MQPLDEGRKVFAEPHWVLPPRSVSGGGVHDQLRVRDAIGKHLLHVASDESVSISPDEKSGSANARQL